MATDIVGSLDKSEGPEKLESPEELECLPDDEDDDDTDLGDEDNASDNNNVSKKKKIIVACGLVVVAIIVVVMVNIFGIVTDVIPNFENVCTNHNWQSFECADLEPCGYRFHHAADETAGDDPNYRGNRCNDQGEIIAVVQGDSLLEGTIPTEIGLLTSLKYCDLYVNDITGTLPTEIGMLTVMTDMDFWNNGLNGTVPTELGKLSMLKYLGLDWNELTGNMDHIFCDTSIPSFIDREKFPFLSELRADCHKPEVQCSCCTKCTKTIMELTDAADDQWMDDYAD